MIKLKGLNNAVQYNIKQTYLYIVVAHFKAVTVVNSTRRKK